MSDNLSWVIRKGTKKGAGDYYYFDVDRESGHCDAKWDPQRDKADRFDTWEEAQDNLCSMIDTCRVVRLRKKAPPTARPRVDELVAVVQDPMMAAMSGTSRIELGVLKEIVGERVRVQMLNGDRYAGYMEDLRIVKPRNDGLPKMSRPNEQGLRPKAHGRSPDAKGGGSRGRAKSTAIRARKRKAGGSLD